ncbi:MAG: glycosyltransferase [Armatimonadota bacterium]|nr:glycosyltransferase [Armatimonadota bacterium]
MDGLRVLICNITLASRSGTETYVRDLALGLLQRGHTPIVYSPNLGPIAQELRSASIPVLDDLRKLAVTPDVIHGQHSAETMTALLHFPDRPAVYSFHDSVSWHSIPPHFPRILRYVAVDLTCRDRMVCEHGIPEDRVRVLLNAVDLKRFQPRGPLPPRPQRALIFNNNATETTHLPAVRAACARTGLTLDVIGARAGTVHSQPEAVLGQYDLVFAVARCCLEALAVGNAVVLCDHRGAGPLVTTGELERLRPLNFGLRTLVNPTRPDVLVAEIARYNPEDAAAVSQHIRATAGLDAAIDAAIALYQEVLTEHAELHIDPADEGRAAAAYLRSLAPLLQEREVFRLERDHYQAEWLTLRRSKMGQAVHRLRQVPLLGALIRRLARRLAGRGSR